MFCWKECLMSYNLSFYSSWLVMKIAPFLILYKKYRMFSCTTCWDCCQSWLGSHQQIWEFFFLTEQLVRLPSCFTFIITIGLFQLFSNPLNCPLFDLQTLWNLLIVAFSANIMQKSLLFPNFCRIELYHGAAFLTGIVHLTSLLHSWQNLKQSALVQ